MPHPFTSDMREEEEEEGDKPVSLSLSPVLWVVSPGERKTDRTQVGTRRRGCGLSKYVSKISVCNVPNYVISILCNSKKCQSSLCPKST